MVLHPGRQSTCLKGGISVCNEFLIILCAVEETQ